MKKTNIAFLLLLWVQMTGYAQPIDLEKIREHIQFLSSDELQGRLPGTEAEKKAAKYIWDELKAIGCEPFYNEGYQHFSKEMQSRNESNEPFILKGRNVVGYIKGSKDPDNYIVAGAHYDHLGLGGTGSGSRQPDTVAVHNGADDNASGVAAMIETARFLSVKKPDCSIIFVAFSAEEKGLIGSQYFVENAPVAKEKIKAMINFDMVGRLDSVLTIQGTGTALEFDSLIAPLENSKKPFQIKQIPGGFGPSDQTSFYAEKIPVLYFHTSIHEQYHTPYDDIELINIEGVAEIANLASEIIVEIADQSQTITYQAIGNQSDASRRGMKATLGIMPDHTSVNGLKINAIRPGQAAENGGLLKGDIILNIQGEKVEDIESYMTLMNKYGKGDRIVIDVLRNDEKLIFTINL